jgi:hypothetical protein
VVSRSGSTIYHQQQKPDVPVVAPIPPDTAQIIAELRAHVARLEEQNSSLKIQLTEQQLSERAARNKLKEFEAKLASMHVSKCAQLRLWSLRLKYFSMALISLLIDKVPPDLHHFLVRCSQHIRLI